jgi:FdhD protein
MGPMLIDNESARTLSVRRVTRDGARAGDDTVVVEEPMEIRIVCGSGANRSAKSLSVTMRTPGHDFELAAGFLFTERILSSAAQIEEITFCGPPAPSRSTSNIVRVEVDPSVDFDLERLRRNFFASSSCGICGKASLDAVEVPDLPPLDAAHPRIRSAMIHDLPKLLRSSQPVFERTGGLHAAGLVDPDGKLYDVREDVGRHNAVDKLLGRSFLDGKTPLSDRLMVISGRASFEILQKALAAGVPMIVAIGPPSSLAVDLAERFGMTLIGFASPERFNVYSGSQRMI